MKLIIAGDFSPRFELDELIENGKASPFRNINDIIIKADFSILNFETTLKSTGSEIDKSGPSLCCSKHSIDIIKKAGFNVATLANNHTLDHGEEGLKNTIEYFEAIGIKTVGAGNNLEAAERPLILEENGSKVAIINCCEHEFSIADESNAGCAPLDPIRQYRSIQKAKTLADYIIVIVHGGHELYQLPSIRMQETYRYFIDLGVDAVINHHQHCLSGYEIYNGKPIFYGLGNLLFNNKDIKSKSLWNEGFLVELELSNNVTFKIHPYIQCLGDFEIHLITDSSEFDKKISELNSIISNPHLLSKNNEENYLSKLKWYRSALEPYRNRYIIQAYVVGLLPSLLSKKKLTYILNLIMCESHRDRLITILKKLIK